MTKSRAPKARPPRISCGTVRFSGAGRHTAAPERRAAHQLLVIVVLPSPPGIPQTLRLLGSSLRAYPTCARGEKNGACGTGREILRAGEFLLASLPSRG